LAWTRKKKECGGMVLHNNGKESRFYLWVIVSLVVFTTWWLTVQKFVPASMAHAVTVFLLTALSLGFLKEKIGWDV